MPFYVQAMLPGAVATDLYHWNRMRIAHAENCTKRRSQAPVQQQHSRSQISESVGGSQGTQVAAHTGVYGQAAAAWTGTMPVAFLLSHEDSHTRRVLSMRRASGGQCISDRLAKELLGLTRSEEDVAQVLQGLIYPGVAEHPPFVWVDHASAALVSAAVTQYVIHQAWAPALRLLERAIKVDRQVWNLLYRQPCVLDMNSCTCVSADLSADLCRMVLLQSTTARLQQWKNLSVFWISRSQPASSAHETLQR